MTAFERGERVIIRRLHQGEQRASLGTVAADDSHAVVEVMLVDAAHAPARCCDSARSYLVTSFVIGDRVVVCDSWPIVGGCVGTVTAIGRTPFKQPTSVYRVRLDRFNGHMTARSPSIHSRHPWTFGPYDEQCLGFTSTIRPKELDFMANELSHLDAITWLSEHA